MLPPCTGVAVKVILVPMQIVSSVFATIPTEGVTALFTVSIILLEVTESGVVQVALLINTQVTTS